MENKKGFVIDAFESINLPYDELLLFRKSKPLGKDGLIIIKRHEESVIYSAFRENFKNILDTTINPEDKEEIKKSFLKSKGKSPIFGLAIYKKEGGLSLGSLQIKEGEVVLLEIHDNPEVVLDENIAIKIGIYKLLDTMKVPIYESLTFSEFKSLLKIAPIIYNWFSSKKANLDKKASHRLNGSKNIYDPKKKEIYK